MEIIEYNSNYEEDVKDLLVELQKYIVEIDREKYNILTDDFREECFKDNMKEIAKNRGRMFLALENDKAIALIIGLIIEAEKDYEFNAPKSGKVSELVVSKKSRAKGIGKMLMNKMEDYFKSEGCKRILIEVFEYNDLAKSFYSKNGYFSRTTEVMKKLDK